MWAGRGLGVTGRGERTRRANGSCGLAVWGRAQRCEMVPASGRLCGRRARQGTLAAPLALKSHTSASSCVSGASRTTGPPREPRVGAPGGWCTGPLRGRPGFRRSPSPPRDRIRARRHGRMRGLRFPARVARCGAGSSCSFWGDRSGARCRCSRRASGRVCGPLRPGGLRMSLVPGRLIEGRSVVSLRL